MGDTEHTPGPWTLDGWHVKGGPGGLFIAAVHDEPFRRESRRESRANARLIAAAPDLLEAAKRVLRATPRDWRNTWPEMSDLDAAIAKAEGSDQDG